MNKYIKKAIRAVFPVQTSKELINVYRRVIEQDLRFLPQRIHVETQTRCNSKCAFCAASVQHEKRPNLVMPDELIDKILDELEEINYSNYLFFYNNNEPFLDQRIFEIIAKARKMLPNVYLELISNGTLLNMEKVIQIFDNGLDSLKINDYRGADHVIKGEQSSNIQKIKDEVASGRRFKGEIVDGKYSMRIRINLKCIDAVLGKRAGSAPNRKDKIDVMSSPCLRAFEMLTVNPEGKVALCSNDLYVEESMGNVNEQSLISIWQSPAYQQVRQELLKGNRSIKSTCSKCDHRGYDLQEMLVTNNLYPKTIFGKFRYGLIVQA